MKSDGGEVVRIVYVHKGKGLPVGYGSRLSSGSEEGRKRDSTGAAYRTVSYRPAKKSRGKEVAVVEESVIEEDLGEGRRVKWATFAEGFFCHS